MRQILYAMQFTGHASPAEGRPSVLRAATSAPSCAITSIVGPNGVAGSIDHASGGRASFESEVTFSTDSSFQESGAIAFGPGHRLRFTTVGQGYLGPSADPQLKHGAVTWRIDGGEGQFQGASGLITSNFTVGETGEVTDNHFGIVFLRS